MLKKTTYILLAIILIVLVVLIFSQKLVKNDLIKQSLKYNMKISSSKFNNNDLISKKYTCDGDNVNPPLDFSGIPVGTKSLAVIVDDPDAPSGTWTHWVVWNIEPNTSKIEEDSAPVNAIEGVNSYSKTSYDGPCPPSGTHHYFFKVFALDFKPNLSYSSGAKELEEAMIGHILEFAEISVKYSREK